MFTYSDNNQYGNENCALVKLYSGIGQEVNNWLTKMTSLGQSEEWMKTGSGPILRWGRKRPVVAKGKSFYPSILTECSGRAPEN